MTTLRAPLALLVLLSAASPVAASVITQPSGLTPGDQYRLVFVTSVLTDALSSDISTYNSLVSNAAGAVPALAALGTQWSIIGSTASVDAQDNTGTNPSQGVGVPIYRLDGVQVAANNADLWDSSLSAPISVFEDGSPAGDVGVWSGTNSSGRGVAFGNVLGSSFASFLGSTVRADGGWIQATASFTTNSAPVYGISGVLTVPTITAIPEPSSLLCFSLVGLGVEMGRRRRTRRDGVGLRRHLEYGRTP